MHYFITTLQSEYFHSLSLEPVISEIKIRKILDISGNKAVEVDLYCTIDGVSKVSQLTACNDSYSSAQTFTHTTTQSSNSYKIQVHSRIVITFKLC